VGQPAVLVGNALLTYVFATEGASVVCHDLPCRPGPGPAYVLVFAGCAVAGIVDLWYSTTATVRAIRRAPTAPARVAFGVAATVSGAVMLVLVILWTLFP